MFELNQHLILFCGIGLGFCVIILVFLNLAPIPIVYRDRDFPPDLNPVPVERW